MAGLLNHSPEDIIAQLLIDLGYGTEPTEDDQNTDPDSDWAVYSTSITDFPDRFIGVLGTVGIDLGRLNPTGERNELHGITITIRSTKPGEGHVKANAIAIGIDSVYDRTVLVEDWTGTGSTYYNVHCLSRIGPPIPIGKGTPSDKRNHFTINLLATIRQLD